MSEPTPDSRPASIGSLVAIFAAFALFLLPVYFGYVRHRPVTLFLPESAPAEHLSKEELWQATPESRLAYLNDLKARQEKQLGSYAWIDRKNGVVQLPIDRAMDLVVLKYGNKAP